MAEKHPEFVAYMMAMIKVGTWANAHKRAAAAIFYKQTFYLDVDHTYRGIKLSTGVGMIRALIYTTITWRYILYGKKNN